MQPDVSDLNAKFDEVYGKGGIYHFMSHPQSLDFGPFGFYEQHLSHISRRPDIWYVPMGPIYAFHTIVEKTSVRNVQPTGGNGTKARFVVSNDLDPQNLQRQLTLDFTAPESIGGVCQWQKTGGADRAAAHRSLERRVRPPRG